MSFPEKLVYIAKSNGLCNRLEMLMAAHAIRRRFGHKVLLDWYDYSLMHLPQTCFGRPSWWRRLIGSQEIDEERSIESVSTGRTVQLRTLAPFRAELIQAELSECANRIRPSSSLRSELLKTFGWLDGGIVVGVHIRQGDFKPQEGNAYRAINGRHTRVPIWWYLHTMRSIVSAIPEVKFFISYSGDRESLYCLEQEFDCIVGSLGSPVKLSRSGHRADSNPVADLFVLASCSTILGTPASSFSHWAASNLGPHSMVVVPPLVTYRDDPCLTVSTLRYRPLSDWVNFSWRCQPGSIHSAWQRDWSVPRFDTRWW